MKRHEKRRIVALAAEAGAEIVKIWGTGVGLRLTACYYSDEPWATAKQIANDLTVSEDTVRRRLDELVAVKRVAVRREGRTSYYMAKPRWAERTFKAIHKLLLSAKCE